MKIRRRKKLHLIENYVDIYRILYNCKQLMTTSNIDTISLKSICDQTLDLKSKYENAFSKLKMIDSSFLILKEQLNDYKAFKDNNIASYTISELQEFLNIIEQDYLQLGLYKKPQR